MAARTFEDSFDGPALDRSVWLPHYLPVWSSLARTRATYALRDSCLHLSIPPGQGLWCPGDHTPPMRVSGIQSANRSGPVGSTVGQQPYRPGLLVAEEQARFDGWTPSEGYVEVRMRGEVTARSMFAFWMVGPEDVPERSGEICVAELFGDAMEPGRAAAVGMGLHSFRDPAVPEDFDAVNLEIDAAQFHTYAVEWDRERAEFSVDGQVVRSCSAPPTYPMTLMLAVFDFPDRPGPADHVPSLVVDHVRGRNR